MKISNLYTNKKGKYNAVDAITRTKTTVAWDEATKKWQVVQHYPVAEGWNNLTKTYSPTTKANVKVTLPPKGGNK